MTKSARLGKVILGLVVLILFGLSGCGGDAQIATPTANNPTPSPNGTTIIVPPATPKAILTPVKEVTIGPLPTITSNGKTVPIPATPFGVGAPQPCSPTPHGDTTTSPIDDAPLRSSVGTGHVLSGVVRSSKDCTPIEKAKIIFWVAGPNGKYDDDHRAAIITDSRGTYRFESNYPGLYGSRPVPHIHLYATATRYGDLETEYFPPKGATEGTFDLVLALAV